MLPYALFHSIASLPFFSPCPIIHELSSLFQGKFTAGQNMIIYSSDWKRVIKAWFEEVTEFKYNVTDDVFKTGYYTQVIKKKLCYKLTIIFFRKQSNSFFFL